MHQMFDLWKSMYTMFDGKPPDSKDNAKHKEK